MSQFSEVRVVSWCEQLVLSRLSLLWGALISFVRSSIGVELLRRMGWREGQGVGPRVKRKARRQQTGTYDAYEVILHHKSVFWVSHNCPLQTDVTENDELYWSSWGKTIWIQTVTGLVKKNITMCTETSQISIAESTSPQFVCMSQTLN